MRTLKDKVRALRRKYKKVTPARYFFNVAADKKGKFNAIKLWILIHDVNKGYSIFSFIMRRKINLTMGQWFKYWSVPHPGYKASIYSSVTNGILPAINNKNGTEWAFKSLLGWTRYAVSKRHNPATNSRVKTTKKRKTNARNRARH
jgi:hypothetical protein